MTECPSWSESIPAAREREFAAVLRTIYRCVAALAAREVIDYLTPAHWHGQLFRDFVPLHYYAGNYRQTDPARPCLAVDVGIQGRRGTPSQSVTSEMESLFFRLRATLIQFELNWPILSPAERARRLALLLAALIGRFIRIHPLVNGNGRVSRLLWAWGLLRFGVSPQCRIHPRPTPPYADVMAQSMAGDDGPLALHILRHLASEQPTLQIPTEDSSL